MNCYNHPDRPAVIQCRNCGKGFCHEEADLFVDGLCPECQKKANIKVKEERKAGGCSVMYHSHPFHLNS